MAPVEGPMRKIARTLALAGVVGLAASGTVAEPAPPADQMARAEASVLPQPVATPGKPTRVNDVRDCAALVLVGSMLIGLAAAVRRTA